MVLHLQKPIKTEQYNWEMNKETAKNEFTQNY